MTNLVSGTKLLVDRQNKGRSTSLQGQNAGLKNRLIFRVYQLCLHTQAFVWGLGAYLKPLFLKPEEVMPFKRSIDLTRVSNSKLYQQ
ncbi:hypothetical protein QUA56_27950 [Microcoleus sp. N3A4]|uniref:hypothetical protein n=1 Tax=Microcoleus sp. N3A4 TaxID=3055379 RepID=UPI002FD26F26